jgi:type I site-specific restriction-modification system R (restriction) subunit
LQLETLLKGVFEKARLLDLIRNFIVFEGDGEKVVKKLAGYRQFHAVNKAVATTVEASRAKGDRRAGVIWHTQGSGKSLSMVFYAGKIVQHPAMENPTIVALTDRNDLDDQLFDTFSFCKELLRQTPIQAASRRHLRELLNRASGGVIFTTIQKFVPLILSPSPKGRRERERRALSRRFRVFWNVGYRTEIAAGTNASGRFVVGLAQKSTIARRKVPSATPVRRLHLRSLLSRRQAGR